MHLWVCRSLSQSRETGAVETARGTSLEISENLMSKNMTITETTARYASWALAHHIEWKRRALAELVAENDPDLDCEIAELKDDITLYESAFNELREHL